MENGLTPWLDDSRNASDLALFHETQLFDLSKPLRTATLALFLDT